MQSANKAFWKDILIHKCKHVPWKVKCQRLVDHVHAVFAFGSEDLLWTIETMERNKVWETKTMLRLFRFKRHKEETWVNNQSHKNVQYGQEDMGTDGLSLRV